MKNPPSAILRPPSASSRRRFLQSAALSAAAPFILPSRIWGADTAPGAKLVMGFIGMGKQSRGLLGRFLADEAVQVVAVCDVDTTRRNAGATAAASVTSSGTANARTPDDAAIRSRSA